MILPPAVGVGNRAPLVTVPMAEVARNYLGCGLSVIPILPAAPGSTDRRAGKCPVDGWKMYQCRRADRAKVEGWFGRGNPGRLNIAIVTGAVSNVVVIDADSSEAVRWVEQNCAATPVKTVTASGTDLYYRHPHVPIRNGQKLLGMALDVRGDGGYVLAAPSVHRTGVVYRGLGDWIPASFQSLPVFEPAWLEGGPGRRRATAVEPGPGHGHIKRVLTLLEGVRPCGRGWEAYCPSHADRKPSLTIGLGQNGRVLLHCFAGCEVVDILGRLSLTWQDLYPPRSPTGKTAGFRMGTASKHAALDRGWGRAAQTFQENLSDESLAELARSLSLPTDCLRTLGVGWNADDPLGRCWTFPEVDGRGMVIGINRRFEDGSKRVMRGSRRGLYVPAGWAERTGPVFCPEGASDTAALISQNLPAVGRSSCTGGAELLAELFRGVDRDIVIVGDNDQKAGGRWPGRDGATRWRLGSAPCSAGPSSSACRQKASRTYGITSSRRRAGRDRLGREGCPCFSTSATTGKRETCRCRSGRGGRH